MPEVQKPHSRPPVEIVREALEHVRYNEHDGYTPWLVQESFESLVEQLEAKQKRLDWYERLQGDLNDADFDAFVREELHSNPASGSES